jgi:hypothetical protein
MSMSTEPEKGPERQWREAARKVRRGTLAALQAVCGWLLLYLAIGGLLGFGFDAPFTTEPSCVPFSSVFGLLQTSCRVEVVNRLWSIAVGWPRLAIVFPALAIALLRTAVENADYLLEASAWILYSMPLFAVLYAGALYWRKRHRGVADIITVAMIGEILVLGFSMR